MLSSIRDPSEGGVLMKYIRPCNLEQHSLPQVVLMLGGYRLSDPTKPLLIVLLFLYAHIRSDCALRLKESTQFISMGSVVQQNNQLLRVVRVILTTFYYILVQSPHNKRWLHVSIN